MNLRNKGVRRLPNRKGPQCWVFRFPLDSVWLWFWALPFFQWHKQQGMQLYWEERFWLDWERSKLFWGLEASRPPVLPWLFPFLKPSSRGRLPKLNNSHHPSVATLGCDGWRGLWAQTANNLVPACIHYDSKIGKVLSDVIQLFARDIPVAIRWPSPWLSRSLAADFFIWWRNC